MKKYLSLIAVAACLTSCSPYALVNSETYNNADLAQYHTFRIVTPDMGQLPPGMEMVTYHNIATAISEQMIERGYTQDPNSPLLINIAVTTRREIQTEPLMPPTPPVPPVPPVGAPIPPAGAGVPPVTPPPPPGYLPYHGPYYPYYIWPRYNYGPYWSGAYAGQTPQVITGIYREGVLTMDFVNIDTKVPLYSASVATILNGGGNGYQNLKGIAEAVQTLFSKFPVAVLPQYKANK